MKRDDDKRDEQMLTPREARMVAEYVKGDGLAAAQKRANIKNGRQVLDRPHVKAELERRAKQVIDKSVVSVERVIEELARIAFANVDDFVDRDYKLGERPNRKVMAAVRQVVVKDGEVRLQMHDKIAALDKLGRHLGMFSEKIEVDIKIAERLARALEARDAMDAADNE